MSRKLSEFWRWAAESEGSTRPAALIRMGLAAIVWARYGSEVALFHDPGWDRAAFALAFAPAVTMMFFGIWTRLSTVATALLLTAVYGYGAIYLDRSGYHHVYLLTEAVWFSALTPAGRSFSWDRWRALRRGDALPERGNLWGQRLMAIQVVILYFWAAYDKTEAGYFSGERLEMLYLYVYGGARYPYEIPWFRTACAILCWATVAIEFSLAFGLFVARVRVPLMAAGAIFHGVIYLTLPVFTFSATILLLYVAFLDPDEVHRRVDVLAAPAEPNWRRG